MNRVPQVKWAKYRLREAEYKILLSDQNDKFTSTTVLINQSTGSVLAIPTYPIQLITTGVLGVLNVVSFGLITLIGSVIWWIFLLPLLGYSWLWLKLPIIKPLLFLPGILWARISGIYVSLMPAMGEWEARHLKLALCDYWPVSWYILKPPDEQENNAETLS